MKTRAIRSAFTILLFTTSLSVSCGDDAKEIDLSLMCGEGISGTLAVGATLQVEAKDALALRGAAVHAPEKSTPPVEAISISCSGDIVSDGFVALGPAITFGPVGSWSDRAFELSVPFKPGLLPEGAVDRHVRLIAKRHVGNRTPFFPPLANRKITMGDNGISTFTIRSGELMTVQVVAAADAGTPITRRRTYRAIIGISMGGNASLSVALRNHERFDLIGDLGGEPGPSMTYTLEFMRTFMFGGFCTALDQANGVGNIGEMCLDSRRAPLHDQFEITADFEHFVYQSGDGVGLTLSRDLYIKASRDLARALGNPSLYNPDDSYLPPGIPASYLELSAGDRCDGTAKPSYTLYDFYDHEFNPDGSKPVIPVCDGGFTTETGLGNFNPDVAQDNPTEIMLAVDINENGIRDSGEPVIGNYFEPFDDVGTDGIKNEDEEGFDAVTNPDPAGDNYHYLRNPLGTENNWKWEDGEPYQDVGLDGVANTCQYGDDPGDKSNCYDYGEADGKWTLSPNVQRWYDSDIDILLAKMTPAERDRISFWIDAGIRDFLNGAISANSGVGALSAKYGRNVAVYEGFAPLQGVKREARYDFSEIQWDDIPRDVYLRYGNPDATENEIRLGDGRHVGTAIQIINRVTTAFAWINAQWENGNHEPIQKAGEILEDLTFTPPTTQRETPYAMFLPPGYSDAENADKTYPVVYFLHGYGMDPSDLVLVSAIFENYMTNPSWEPEKRFQKLIIVYVDGRCRPEQNGVPLEGAGDRCERGTFYMDSPGGGPAQMETNLLELMDYIDANYRTKAAEDVSFVP